MRRLLIAGFCVAVAACSGAVTTSTAPFGTTATPTETTAAPETTTAAPETTTTSAPGTTTIPANTTIAANTTTSPEVGTVFDITVEAGTVTGGGRVAVEVDQVVTLRVTSDVAEEVHVHGYDLFEFVEAGETIEIVFSANIPGVFEIELEASGLVLAELEVVG